ncbi:unnamed protein product [Rotaria socialis]|uniref:Uncharacterized protein n=1 Tax=Rotaria socialis TaxID=392032 RepID=A0A818QH08_9BILA|nr:unnamed protein product [Rotaria socialis]CAF4386093.1 unnamed protein product [Rotaria socialis]
MSNNDSEKSGHIKVDIPTSSLPDGNWRNIDLAVLFDKNKCDLTECDLKDVYRILDCSPLGLNDDEINERREKVSLIINLRFIMSNQYSGISVQAFS